MRKSGEFTISEVSKIIGVHPNTLRKWEREKKLIPTRDKISKYRYYRGEQIRDFLLRGKLSKIEIHWGHEYAKQARREELRKVNNTLDVIVSSGVSTSGKEFDQELYDLWELLIKRGVKGRFIRDLSIPRMKEIAVQHKAFGIETRNRKVAGLTISIRDRKVVRIEVPSDNPEQRLFLIINDSKVANSFEMMFEKLWGR